MSAPPEIHRIVKPRKPADESRGIIAVDQRAGMVLLERTGEILPVEKLPRILTDEASSIIVTHGAPRLLQLLHAELADTPGWNASLAPVKRDILTSTNGKRRRVTETIVQWLGWKSPTTKKAGHYHYPIDPATFCLKTINELLPGDTLTVYKMLLWGIDVREWCRENGLVVRGRSGGLAAQLLRDPRFFPEARRKVPKATNARARFVLPGNHYQLNVPEGQGNAAYYLDMRSAHHSIAARLAFPHPDTFQARGRFRVTDAPEATPKKWATPGTRSFERTLQAHGLLRVHLSVPPIPAERFPLPYMAKPGSRMAWVFTNELETIRELGGSIDWIEAAWVSWDRCEGLNRFANWALREQEAASETRKRWLKSTLLATYGMLAAKPRMSEWAFLSPNGGIPKSYPAGSAMLDVWATQSETEEESKIANVVYRGLIEAEQRVMALRLARDLTGTGSRVLAVYADSVFVDSRDPLPFLPEPWRVEGELDRLVFFDSTHFTSHQLTKLPGMPREMGDRVRRYQQIRSRIAS